MLHANYHPYFSRAANLQHYHDIFLIDLRGNVVYSYAKEVDFASNLQTGPDADSNLAQTVRTALEGRSGITYFSDFAHYGPSADAPAAFIATQVVDRKGKTIGIVAAQLDSSLLDTLLDDKRSGADTYLVGTDGLARSAVLQAGEAGILTALPDLPQVRAAAAGEAAFFSDVMLTNGQIGFARTQPLDMGGVPWGLVVERDRADALGPINHILLQILLIATGLAAILLVLGYLFARSVTRPIGRIGAVMGEIADGHLDVSVTDTDRQDEIGQIGQALQALQAKLTTARLAEEERARMQEDLRLVVETLRAAMNDLAVGDLSRPIEEEFSVEYEGLRTDFNQTIATLSDTITQVVEAAQNIRSRSNEISAASEDLSRRTENQAAALEETAAALDELTVSVKSAADSAREVEGIVRQARKEAEESGVVVQGAVAAMAEIEKSSEQISQIIGAIDDIAFQTNLLALNAGVEAARAGDAGKGFAVVASEVRALAHRSSAAAKEIKALISASALHVGRGVDQVGRAGEALHSIVGSVGNVATLVSTIAAGAAEQSTGLGEINVGVTQLDQVTQQNAAMVEESTAASHMLHQDATGLSDLVARFRLPGAELPEPDETAEPAEIAMSPFVPSSFASSETLAAEAAGELRPIPLRAAGAAGASIWQDF
jgi:methyl-accepting chemotaxis protein